MRVTWLVGLSLCLIGAALWKSTPGLTGSAVDKTNRVALVDAASQFVAQLDAVKSLKLCCLMVLRIGFSGISFHWSLEKDSH